VIRFILLALALTACTCGPVIPPVDPNPPEPVEPPDPVPVDDCEAAGATLERLQCRDETGSPLWEGPTGESFADACQRLIGDGVPWDAACIATLTDCDDYNAAATGELCADGGAP